MAVEIQDNVRLSYGIELQLFLFYVLGKRW